MLKSYPTGWWTHSYETADIYGDVSSASHDRHGNETNTFLGDSLPNWRQLIKAGTGASTHAAGIKWHFSLPSGGAFVSWVYYPNPFNLSIQLHGQQEYHGCMTYADPPIPSFGLGGDTALGAAESQARLKFLQKYREARNTFQGGTFIGEIAETIEMLKHPAKLFREGIDHYVQAAKKRAARRGLTAKTRNKIVSETWLEYAYGWRPLWQDIQDLSKALYDRPDRIYDTIEAHADVPYNWSMESGQAGSEISAFLGWTYSKIITGVASVRLIGAVDCSVPCPSFAAKLGFSADNFVPTVWNLIPYSFLVDYFTNIGDLIDSMSLGRVILAWGNKTSRLKATGRNTNFRYNGLKSEPNKYAVLSQYVFSPDQVVTLVSFQRDGFSYVDAGISDFTFRVPGVSSTRWLNIGALAHLRSLKD